MIKVGKRLSSEQRRVLLPVIFLIGISLIVLGVNQNRRLTQSIPVTGEIIGYREVSSDNIMARDGETTVYYTEYHYTLDGEEYTVVSDNASATIPIVGKCETIYVSAMDEGSIVLSGQTYVLIGIAFDVFAAVLFLGEVIVLRNQRKEL